MEYINTKKSNNGFSPFLLIWVVFAIVFLVKVFIFAGFNFALLLLLVFLTIPILYFLDIFLWHIIGKEIIYTQDKKLIIKKVNRIRPRKKKIRFEKIEDIYLLREKEFLKNIYSSMSAFWDWDKQGTICIKYDNGCKYYIGRNLNETEAEDLLRLLKSEIPNTPANPTIKSEIIEWVVFGSVILLIVVIAIGFII
ncbi:MAG: hypothetical protein ACOXZH_09430 [Bacteroidales bacterium]|jgi:hypothetical protein|nr:hypothetical protein [Bacteroidales bacterium]